MARKKTAKAKTAKAKTAKTKAKTAKAKTAKTKAKSAKTEAAKTKTAKTKPKSAKTEAAKTKTAKTKAKSAKTEAAKTKTAKTKPKTTNAKTTKPKAAKAKARRTKPAKQRTELPEPGSAFLMPLGDCRYGVCRVIQRDAETLGFAQIRLYEASRWIGADAPDVNDPVLREPLLLTHHSWGGEACRLWDDEPPPPSFLPLGVIEPTDDDLRVTCRSFGSCEGLALDRLAQWRWEHEREAVLAEDEEEQRRIEAEQRAHAARRKRPTLAALRRRRPFEAWEGFVPAAGIAAAREAVGESLAALAALGRSPSRADVLAVIQQGVERFNDLDGAALEICTIEREDIAEWFGLMAEACGVTDVDDVTEAWRDW